MDPELLTHRRALRAVWVSAAGLGATALLQLAVVGFTRSAGLFADALHNVGDVLGTLTLWVAFTLSRRPASDTFPFGWRRAEDLAGVVIMLAIVASAVLAGWDSVQALLSEGHEVRNPAWALLAAVIGIAGNEGVAQYKIRVGKDIHSVALIADGQHARVDGLASAAAAGGIVGAWLGLPVLDAVAGLVITAAILWILRDVARDVLLRTMDAVDPGLLGRLRACVQDIDGVLGVHAVRARHLGRSLAVQLHVEADPETSLRDAHAIAEEVRHRLVHEVPTVISVDVHMDPYGEREQAHRATAHHFGGHGSQPPAAP